MAIKIWHKYIVSQETSVSMSDRVLWTTSPTSFIWTIRIHINLLDRWMLGEVIFIFHKFTNNSSDLKTIPSIRHTPNLWETVLAQISDTDEKGVSRHLGDTRVWRVLVWPKYKFVKFSACWFRKCKLWDIVGNFIFLLNLSFYPNVTALRSGLCCRNSVCRLSVVCNVGAPYSVGWSFRQYFFTAVYADRPLISVQNFTEVVPGEPPTPEA